MNDLTTRYESDGFDLDIESDASNATVSGRKRPRRRIRTIAFSASGVLVLTGALGAFLWQQNSTSSVPEGRALQISDTPVTKGSVVVETNASGVLGYSAQRPLVSGPAGIVTSLLPVGTSVGAGSVLYSVNSRPVILFSGAVPAWRTFESGMSLGEDVRQLETNLAAFGFFHGDIDNKFTYLTAQAIEQWQKAIGVEPTGSVERSEILFSTADIRIAEYKSTVGANVGEGTELYLISSNEKQVNVNLKLSDQQLAIVDAPVAIVLPGGAEMPGVVASVGAPTEQAGADPSAKKTVVLPVTISLVDPAAAAAFDRATVTARFSSTLSADALTVPVEALLAIDDKTFAVEVSNDDPEKAMKRIAVTTGAFGSGRVEISGDGIAEGLSVVVPKR